MNFPVYYISHLTHHKMRLDNFQSAYLSWCAISLMKKEISLRSSLYMPFDRFLLSFESRDLSQTDKILIIGSSLVKLSSLVNTFFLKKVLFPQA